MLISISIQRRIIDILDGVEIVAFDLDRIIIYYKIFVIIPGPMIIDAVIMLAANSGSILRIVHFAFYHFDQNHEHETES